MMKLTEYPWESQNDAFWDKNDAFWDTNDTFGDTNDAFRDTNDAFWDTNDAFWDTLYRFRTVFTLPSTWKCRSPSSFVNE